jgi:hypothetical protein
MFDRCSLEVSFLPSLLPSFVLPSCSSSSVAFLMFRLCIFGALLSFLEKSLSKVYRKSIEVYRTSIDQSRKSIESLSKAYRKSIGKCIETSIESLSNICRNSIESPPKFYRKSIESLSNIYIWICMDSHGSGVETPTSICFGHH